MQFDGAAGVVASENRRVPSQSEKFMKIMKVFLVSGIAANLLLAADASAATHAAESQAATTVSSATLHAQKLATATLAAINTEAMFVPSSTVASATASVTLSSTGLLALTTLNRAYPNRNDNATVPAIDTNNIDTSNIDTSNREATENGVAQSKNATSDLWLALLAGVGLVLLQLRRKQKLLQPHSLIRTVPRSSLPAPKAALVVAPPQRHANAVSSAFVSG
jgi:hypothetical protein